MLRVIILIEIGGIGTEVRKFLVNRCPGPKSFAASNRFSFRIAFYFTLSNSICSIPARRKRSHSTMPPPPCLVIWIVYSCEVDCLSNIVFCLRCKMLDYGLN
ncbi:hypothetical protein ILYODFUR_033166 [Ilyodon furcidens]|uniref:Uncharacterized protein n=1 Tax=Ilyodon furcidens TaxID=33524 RepID=A0ABV0UY88_9TELE